jgi:hypothetical protein
MGKRRRHLVLLGALAGAFGIALFLGAAERGGAGTTPEKCAGKSLCITITAQDQASLSPAGSDHYLTDSFTVRNAGTSANLVNVTVTVTWEDEDAAETTSAYQDAFSDPRCDPAGEHSLTCEAPKSLGPQETLTYGPLIFRTASAELEASGMTLHVTAAAKEQAKPRKGGAEPNDAAVSDSNTTTYEGNPDLDISIGGGGLATTLATQQVGSQFSKMPIPANTERSFFDILETDCSAGDSTCIGQSITTTAPGVEPVNLQITYEGTLPSGVNENGIVVLHTREGDSEPTVIDDKCSGELFSGQPPMSEIDPDGCRRVKITRITNTIKKVEVDAWDLRNGDWKWG